jgi:hypothetical protein
MPIFEINPLEDSRWTSLVESHPRSSVFHTRAWLEALNRTYHYRPTAFTTCSPDSPLTNGLIFCQVESWLTGRKLVSLPFSDHCDALVQDAADLKPLLSATRESAVHGFKYAEVRPRSDQLTALGCDGVLPYVRYYFHAIDVRPSIEELYSHLHKDSIRRKIQRAEREGVALDQGRSNSLLNEFYELLIRTRRRHAVPPQPFAWFRNLINCFGGLVTIHVARINGHPIASILTLRHKRTLVYKYGCSDERFHSLGGMPRLFWEALRKAKMEQLIEFDLGRSDEDNQGLIRFKDHLGANRTTIQYWRFPDAASVGGSSLNNAMTSTFIQTVLSHLPDALFRLTGEVFYRHAG